MMSKFKVGDVVKITDNGWSFPDFDEWAERHGLPNWEYGRVPANGCICRIVAAETESRHDLYGAQALFTGECYIIDAAGLEQIKTLETENEERKGQIYNPYTGGWTWL